MEEYKDSGIKWIGKIPQNWEMKHFKYIVSEKVDNRGRTPEIDENDEAVLMNTKSMQIYYCKKNMKND